MNKNLKIENKFNNEKKNLKTKIKKINNINTNNKKTKLKTNNKKTKLKTNNKKTKLKTNNYKSKKLIGGVNLAEAAINTIMSGVNLATSMFDAVDGVVNMPRDLNRAVDKSQLNAPGQTEPATAQPMPRSDIQQLQDDNT
jgi:hypothetical protein